MIQVNNGRIGSRIWVVIDLHTRVDKVHRIEIHAAYNLLMEHTVCSCRQSKSHARHRKVLVSAVARKCWIKKSIERSTPVKVRGHAGRTYDRNIIKLSTHHTLIEHKWNILLAGTVIYTHQ